MRSTAFCGKSRSVEKGRCFVGKHAHVDKVELGTGEEERTAEEQFSVQENELEKWLEDRVKKVSTLK